MKKLALALVASTIVAGAASAHTISTGFYAGAAVGYGSTTSKGNTVGGNNANNVVTYSFGDTAASIGIHAGYGWVSACTYFGGEVGYTFENTKINALSGGNAVNGETNITLRRNGYFNARLRAGYLFTPSTMFYIHLGGNMGKYKLNTTNTNTIYNASASKNRFSFAPGLGMETALQKNVYLRGEYTYEFGSSIKATDTAPVPLTTNATKIRAQSFKLGLSYKF